MTALLQLPLWKIRRKHRRRRFRTVTFFGRAQFGRDVARAAIGEYLLDFGRYVGRRRDVPRLDFRRRPADTREQTLALMDVLVVAPQADEAVPWAVIGELHRHGAWVACIGVEPPEALKGKARVAAIKPDPTALLDWICLKTSVFSARR